MTTLNNIHPSMIKSVYFKYFHVFTDNKDQTFEVGNEGYTKSYCEAFKYKDKLFHDGHRNIRIYYIHEIQDPRDKEIIQLEETLLCSIGNFPS